MATCTVVCAECRKVMEGEDPKRIDYRMVVMGGRLRPLCGECYEDRRVVPKPILEKQGRLL